ncbi:hypothetical protein AVEN_172835-1 [Araneus ventricosus]|uniref:Uncharacterized protein n=1 Tax=Araneus ventricosus TaxID=182803 RepID=A0A4Y2BJZ9_ARAVE|nr:hypothetical protein AVEN_172835-1 [Araneus ventricosus]
MELILNRPLQWFVCQLHANELPLGHLFTHVDRTTTGPRSLTGEIRKSLAGCKKLSYFPSWQSDVLKNIARYLTYDEEMKRLRTLLDTVSMEEESLFDDEEEIDDDDEYSSNHDSSTDSDTDIEVDIDSPNENDFYVG